MFYPTAKHNSSAKIKIGNAVPPGAVNLAHYSNRTESNVNNSSVMVSNAEKKTMDSTTGEKWMVKKDLPSKNASVFPLNMFYKDSDGYVGNIKRKDVNWEKRIREDKKNVTVKKSFVLNTKDAPSTVEYTDGKYSGTLYLKSAAYTDGSKSHKEKIIDPPTRKFFSKTLKQENLSSNQAVFQETLGVDEDGFVGILRKITGKTRYISIPVPSSVLTYTKTSPKVNGYFPSFLAEGDVTLYRTGEHETITTDRIVKHYGICRYWGGGNSSPNNYYGNPDYRFSVGGGMAKGYFNDARPTPTLSRYGHWIDEIQSSTKYPIDLGGRYPSHFGIEWEYDIEEAMKYGGSSDPLRGGVVWASDYWSQSGGVWPPSIDPDFLVETGHSWNITNGLITAGSSGSINHNDYILNVKAGPQRTSAMGFYSSKGWYCKWYRNTIAFYKGKTSSSEQLAKYSGIRINAGGYKFTAYQDYEGYLEKENSHEITVIDEYNAECEYCGVVSSVVEVYDGRAHYEGIVYKKTSIADIEQQLVSDNYFYTDYNGKLINYLSGEDFIQSDISMLTNVFKDGVPLHYMYKLKYPVMIPNGPKEETITTTKYIKILNGKFKSPRNIKYLVRLIPTSEADVYTAHILMSSVSRYNNPFYAVYDKHTGGSPAEKEVVTNNLSKYSFSYLEKMSTEPLLVKDRDYVVSYDSFARKNTYTISGNNVISDSRNKIGFAYVVKSVDGKYTSKPIRATAMNAKYAMENEKRNFIGRKLIVSPMANGITMNAREIIKDSFPSILEETLDSILFTTEVYDLSGSVKYKINLFTEQDGSGPVTVETTEDTGFFDSAAGRYIGKLPSTYKYYSSNGMIYSLYHVAYMDQKLVTVLSPSEKDTLEAWHPRVQYSHFSIIDSQNSTRVQATYSMPEYDAQNFSTDGKPYVKISGETAEYVDDHHIKLRNAPLHIITGDDGNIVDGHIDASKFVGATGYPLTVKTWFPEDGIIEVEETISLSDVIKCDYMYVETAYTYKGFTDASDNMISIDLNPNMYHRYTDNTSGAPVEHNTYDLFNRTVYFFFKPTKVENLDTLEVLEENLTSSLYHKIDDAAPEGQFDVMIGKVNLVPSSTLMSTEITDTRVLGGGLVKDMDDMLRKELEPESDYYWNIGNWNGDPFPVNGVVLIRLDKRLLDRFTRTEIEEKVAKHMAFGTLPVIEYVSATENTAPAINELTVIQAEAEIIEL